MRLLRIIIIFGSLFSSCSKNSLPPDYGSSIWAGNYPTQTLNNDSGLYEDHTACITLYFNQNASECDVTTGIVGLLATNMTKYSVNWDSNATFTLYNTKAGQTIQYYSGTITGSTMSLDILSCDTIERPIDLHWLNPTFIE